MTITKNMAHYFLLYLFIALSIAYSMPGTEEDTNPSRSTLQQNAGEARAPDEDRAKRQKLVDSLALLRDMVNLIEDNKNQLKAIKKEEERVPIVDKDLKYKLLSLNRDEAEVDLAVISDKPIRKPLFSNFKPNDKLITTYQKRCAKLEEKWKKLNILYESYIEEAQKSGEILSPSLTKKSEQLVRKAEKLMNESKEINAMLLSHNNFFQITIMGVKYSKRECSLKYPKGRVYDYYHLAQDGWFSPSEGLTQNRSRCCIGNKGLHKPILVREYIMSASPLFFQKRIIKFEGLIAELPPFHPLCLSNNEKLYKALYLTDSSPETSQGTTEYTSGLEVSGTVTVGSVAGTPMGNVSPSAKVTHAKKRNLEDVVIKNKSLTNGNEAKWVFKINNLERNLNKASPISHSTFHPYVQWIWRVDRKKAIKQGLYHHNPDDEKDEQLYFSFENYVQLQATFTRGCLWGICCCGSNATKHSKIIPVLAERITLKIPNKPNKNDKKENSIEIEKIYLLPSSTTSGEDEVKAPEKPTLKRIDSIDFDVLDEEDPLKGYKIEDVQILLRNDANELPIRSTVLKPVGHPQNVYKIDGKKFKRQNVSGERLLCFFNAMGLKVEEEVEKLRSYKNDPIVRYMVANDIVSAAENPEQLSEQVKRAINYTLYEAQRDSVDKLDKIRTKEMAAQSSDSKLQDSKALPEALQNLGQKWNTNVEELRKRAFCLKAFNAFIHYHIAKNDMMNTIPNVHGEDGDNPYADYGSIDAIAYINKLGIKIYQSQQANKKKLQQPPIHYFIPQEATEVVYLYHEGVHFQALVPLSTIKEIRKR